jgi:hypothetical protein
MGVLMPLKKTKVKLTKTATAGKAAATKPAVKALKLPFKGK